ncbi:NAD-dependent epimerase/dehydratase family protein [Faecalimonas sp.]
MKVVVTGATSFIGKQFVLSTVKKGWDIVAVVRKNSTKLSDLKRTSNLEIVELDMDEYYQIGKLTGKCDCFVHFAWNGTRGEERNNQVLQETNYKNSISAIKSIIQVGCGKIITAGSQAEYGCCEGMITEETKCCPNTQYGIYKLKVFERVKQLCEKNNVSYKEPRIFSLYGPGDYEKTLIMSLIDKMKKNEPCNLTQCVQMWEFLYFDDAVNAIIKLCEQDCPNGVYNLGSGDIRKLQEYVEEIKEILRSSSQINYGVVPYPETGMVSIVPSIDRIKKEISWKPCVSFEEGIKSIIAT